MNQLLTSNQQLTEQVKKLKGELKGTYNGREERADLILEVE